MPKPVPDATLQAAIAELDEVRESWLKRPGVTAVDVGYIITQEGVSDDVAIRVHLQRLAHPDAPREDEPFPERLGEFPVVFLEASYGPQAGPELPED